MYSDKITIALGTYNSSKWLSETLKSVKQQGNYPLIVIDNSSTDNTPDILKSHNIPFTTFPHTDKRRYNIKTLRTLQNQAVNTEYMLFLDSDVVLPENAINKAYEYLSTQSPDVVGVAIRYSTGNHYAQGSLLVKTEYAKKVVYDVDNEIVCSCTELQKGIESQGKRFVFLPDLMAIHKGRAEAMNKKEIVRKSSGDFVVPIYQVFNYDSLRKECLELQKELAEKQDILRKIEVML